MLAALPQGSEEQARFTAELTDKLLGRSPKASPLLLQSIAQELAPQVRVPKKQVSLHLC